MGLTRRVADSGEVLIYVACLQRVSKSLQPPGVPCSCHQRRIKLQQVKHRGSHQVCAML